MSDRLDRLPIYELLIRVDTLESQIVKMGNVTYECGDSSSGSTVHMELRVIELDNSHKNMLEMINNMTGDFLATLDVVRKKITEVNTKVNLTMRVLANQALVGGAILVGRIKIHAPKPFCEVRDAKV